METWNRLTSLRGKGGGKRLIKDLSCICALPIDRDSRVMKAWGGVRTGWEDKKGASVKIFKK